MERNQTQEQKSNQLAFYSLLLNVVLTAGKGIVGVIAHSDALLADAAHSGADVAGSIAVLIGIRVARRPADSDHPYGHGKAEEIAASLVAMLLILAGLDVVYSSVRQFLTLSSAPDSLALYTAVIAMLAKEGMYHYQLRVAQKLSSPALYAGAADHRSDVYSSLAAAVGIFLALLGKWNHIQALRLADPVAGFLVAAVVVHIGYQLAKQSYRSLMDQVLDPESTKEMLAVAMAVEGVLRIDDLRARSFGSYLVIDIKLSVDGEATVSAGHRVAKEVKYQMMKRFHSVADVFVHVNPYFTSNE
ncbi:cation diffusion facilitator family transporter [Sulfoacidibacillus thermotolerans]|uniref:Uncharacterized protein n=1 Tax=Sulfoacidibacillus thermotolerans TaxID=1765684 RepID=A0A2U3DBE8_SULT2|nr:cation diffusion facilitator family transporter [Sulfoacidibacillus thermotolerans]PWI58585.1 hypothetical protein BM613_03145 [Sulfoacidibacillus thermotolerans]